MQKTLSSCVKSLIVLWALAFLCICVLALLGPAVPYLYGDTLHIREMVWSPDGEHLAFTASRSPGSEITYQLYVVDLDGDNLRVLSDLLDNVTGAPVWSSDGKKLAITIQSGGNTDIYVADIAGGGDLKRLTKNDVAEFQMVWSPDGEQLIFRTSRWDSSGMVSGLFRINADGSNTQLITDNVPGMNLNTPFVLSGELLQVEGLDTWYEVNINTGNVQPLNEAPDIPDSSLSPDGTRQAKIGCKDTEQAFCYNNRELHVVSTQDASVYFTIDTGDLRDAIGLWNMFRTVIIAGITVVLLIVGFFIYRRYKKRIMPEQLHKWSLL